MVPRLATNFLDKHTQRGYTPLMKELEIPRFKISAAGIKAWLKNKTNWWKLLLLVPAVLLAITWLGQFMRRQQELTFLKEKHAERLLALIAERRRKDDALLQIDQDDEGAQAIIDRRYDATIEVLDKRVKKVEQTFDRSKAEFLRLSNDIWGLPSEGGK